MSTLRHRTVGDGHATQRQGTATTYREVHYREVRDRRGLVVLTTDYTDDTDLYMEPRIARITRIFSCAPQTRFLTNYTNEIAVILDAAAYS